MRFLAEYLMKAAYKTNGISNLLVCDMVKKNKASPDNAKSSIWGGRFSSGPSQLMKDINESISFDRRLYRQDIAGSKAHASMLATCKIISDADCKAIHQGLDQIAQKLKPVALSFPRRLKTYI